MKKILVALITAVFIASNCWGVDIPDFKRGDGSDVIKGSSSESDVDTLLATYLAGPLNVLLANYRQGCALSYASATVVTIGIGEVSTSDSGGTVHRFRKNTAAVTVDFAAANGVGALDTGAIAASTTYYIYAVADATATTFTGIASLSATTPATVSHYKRLGYLTTNSSSQIDTSLIFTDGVAQSMLVASGTAVNGGTIPLPSGYTQGQCKWMVGLGDISGSDDQHSTSLTFTATADASRVVTCGYKGNGNGTVNYIIIGVK